MLIFSNSFLMEKRDITLGKSDILSKFMFVNIKTFLYFCGEKLWNRLSLVLKQCSNVTQFKNLYECMVFKMYMQEKWILLGVHTDYLLIVFIHAMLIIEKNICSKL